MIYGGVRVTVFFLLKIIFYGLKKRKLASRVQKIDITTPTLKERL